MSVQNSVSPPNGQFVRIDFCKKTISALLLSVALLSAAPSYSQEISNNDYYQTGWAFYRIGQLTQAAEVWQTLAQGASSESDDYKKQAALASVLATIVWQQLEDPKAYNTWAEAIRLYLEANTTWEQERLLLKNRITTVRMALQQLTGDVTPNIEVFMSLLLEMDSRYALTDFQTPKAGLKRPSEKSNIVEITDNYLIPKNPETKDNIRSEPILDVHEPVSVNAPETITNNVNPEPSTKESVDIAPSSQSSNTQGVETLVHQKQGIVQDEVIQSIQSEAGTEKVEAQQESSQEASITPKDLFDRNSLQEKTDTQTKEGTNLVEESVFQRHITPVPSD